MIPELDLEVGNLAVLLLCCADAAFGLTDWLIMTGDGLSKALKKVLEVNLGDLKIEALAEVEMELEAELSNSYGAWVGSKGAFFPKHDILWSEFGCRLKIAAIILHPKFDSSGSR